MKKACFVCGWDFDEETGRAKEVPLGSRRIVYVHQDDCLSKLDDALREWAEKWEQEHPLKV